MGARLVPEDAVTHADPAGPRARVGPKVRTWLGALLPGARARRIQSATYAREWVDDNRSALASEGPLWVALGDSTAQGVGASTRSNGYVLAVLRRLRAKRDPAWRVVNLSATGARAADVLDHQIPAMTSLPSPALVTCAVGANDLLRTPQADLEEVPSRGASTAWLAPCEPSAGPQPAAFGGRERDRRRAGGSAPPCPRGPLAPHRATLERQVRRRPFPSQRRGLPRLGRRLLRRARRLSAAPASARCCSTRDGARRASPRTLGPS